MENTEKVVFTPGLSIRSNTKEYKDLDNTLIAGVPGSGLGTLINDMLYAAINANESRRFSYVFIDGRARFASPFSNIKRLSTYNLLMSELVESDYLNSVHKFLETVSMMSVHYTVNEVLLIVIDGFSKLNVETQQLIRRMLQNAKLNAHVKFWIVADSSLGELREVVDKFRYRIITRCGDEGLSNELLGCNVGARCADKYGTCWFYDKQHPDTYSKLNVCFREDSFYERFLRS